MEHEQHTKSNDNSIIAAAEVVGEIIDGILSEMVANIALEDYEQDEQVTDASEEIDQNLLLMHVIEDFTFDDSMCINYDHIDDYDFIDIDELVNTPTSADVDELWNLGTFDNDNLETEEILSINNLLEELSEQKDVSITKKRSYSGHNPITKRNSNTVEHHIVDDSLNNVDTFLKKVSMSAFRNVTEHQFSALETEFNHAGYQNTINTNQGVCQTGPSNAESFQQPTVDDFINVDLLSNQTEIHENPFFEWKRPKIVTDGGRSKLENTSLNTTEPKCREHSSGAKRKQIQNSLLINLESCSQNNSTRCLTCPRRQRIEKLINRKQRTLDNFNKEKILSQKVKITVKADQVADMTLADIETDVIQKYPNWKDSPINVPCYDFPGVKDRISWTEQDINDHISEKFGKLKKECMTLLSEMEKLEESKRAEYLAQELLDLFSLKEKRVKDSYISKIRTIFIENNRDYNQYTSKLLYFCEGQIEEYLRKSENKKFGSLYNIRGSKAELTVKEANIRNLGENPGLVLTGLSNFRHLGNMVKQLGIKLSENISVKKDVQSDSITVKPKADKVIVQFDQVKSMEEKTWRIDHELLTERTHVPPNTEKLLNHIDKAFNQLEKDIRIFQDIFVFLTEEDWEKLDLHFFCCLPNSPLPDELGLCERCRKHIRCREDFLLDEDLALDEIVEASVDCLELYRKILSIYVGVGSLIELKTPSEGYEREKKDLSCVSKLMFNFHAKRKIILLGKEQMNLNYQRLENIDNGCVVLGPYGSGKTDALVFHLDKILDSLQVDSLPESVLKDKSLVLILVWEDKASDLKEYFKELCKLKTYGDNVVIKVLSKSEAFSQYDMESMEDASTTEQINRLCEKLQKVSKYSKTFVLIDEVTIENPTEDLLGEGPFEVGGHVLGWANLIPGDIHLFICVTPDSENFLEKSDYDPTSQQVIENNVKSMLPTILLPRVYRSSNKIHDCMKNLQATCEAEGYVGYNFDPFKEVHGHEIQGETPIWIPLQASDHMICRRNKICKDCFLNNNLQKTLRKIFTDLQKTVPTRDITVILSETAQTGNRLKSIEKTKCQVKAWFSKFITEDSLSFKFDFEFEGMDSPVVIVLRNNGDVRGSLSNCLSRATSKLIILSPNDDHLLLKAKKSGAVKYLTGLSFETETANQKFDRSSTNHKVDYDLRNNSSRDIEYPIKCNYSLMMDCKVSPNDDHLLLKAKNSGAVNYLTGLSLQTEKNNTHISESSTGAIPKAPLLQATSFKEVPSQRNRQRQPSYPPPGQGHSRTPSPTWTVPQFPVQKYNYPPSPHSLPPSPFSPASQNDVNPNVSDQASSSNNHKTQIMGPPSPSVMGPPSPYTQITSRPIKAPPSPFSLPPSPQSNPESPAPHSPSSSSRRRKQGIFPPPPLFN